MGCIFGNNCRHHDGPWGGPGPRGPRGPLGPSHREGPCCGHGPTPPPRRRSNFYGFPRIF